MPRDLLQVSHHIIILHLSKKFSPVGIDLNRNDHSIIRDAFVIQKGVASHAGDAMLGVVGTGNARGNTCVALTVIDSMDLIV